MYLEQEMVSITSWLLTTLTLQILLNSAEFSFSQPITNLYPQKNKDNPVSDARASASHALDNPIGQVIVNEAQNSVTRETLGRALPDFGIGIGLTDIVSSQTGTAHTFYTKYDHGASPVTRLVCSR